MVQVKAIDFDAPYTPNSMISYRIESGGKDKFSINSESGVVRISENAVLDRDLFGSEYLLKVVANDFGRSGLSGTSDAENVCFVKISIIDVNNKKPDFFFNSR